jgi:hypothetical protein
MCKLNSYEHKTRYRAVSLFVTFLDPKTFSADPLGIHEPLVERLMKQQNIQYGVYTNYVWKVGKIPPPHFFAKLSNLDKEHSAVHTKHGLKANFCTTLAFLANQNYLPLSWNGSKTGLAILYVKIHFISATPAALQDLAWSKGILSTFLLEMTIWK